MIHSSMAPKTSPNATWLAAAAPIFAVLKRLAAFDSELADEVTQELWLALLQPNSRNYCPAKGSMGGYLWGVYTNLTRKHRRFRTAQSRLRWRQTTLNECPERFAVTTGESWDDVRGDELEDPAECVGQKRDCDQLMSLLRALPSDQFTVVTLQYWHGMSLRQIAKLQGVSFSTIRRQLLLAYQTLNSELEGRGELCGVALEANGVEQ